MSIITTTCLEEGIFELKMNDPEHENRLSESSIKILLETLDELASNKRMKVVILTGLPEIFCAGGSLDMLQNLATGQFDVRDLTLLPSAVLSFPLPIVAALQGHAIGAGLTLALCCDILIASETSRYGTNYTSMGFTPGVGTTTLLPALLGYHFASEMLLTAKLYKGKELKGRGLFNYVLPTEEVMGSALDIARRIAEKPKHVLELVKAALSTPRRKILQEAITQEHLMHKICFGHPDIAATIETTYLA